MKIPHEKIVLYSFNNFIAIIQNLWRKKRFQKTTSLLIGSSILISGCTIVVQEPRAKETPIAQTNQVDSPKRIVPLAVRIATPPSQPVEQTRKPKPVPVETQQSTSTDVTPVDSRIGYLDNGATVYYANGKSHCGFVNPTHLSFFQKVNPAPSLGRQDPNSFGKYTGACSMPSGYFENEGTVYFSAGNGTFCGFSSGEAYDSHRNARPQETVWGRLDVAPKKFLEYTGVCQ